MKMHGKFLSLLLRHRPELIGLTLDPQGWGSVSLILEKGDITRQELQEIVDTDSKGRFEFSSCGNFIRCTQGHSIAVDLSLVETEPTQSLFHGTSVRHLESIERIGIEKRQRQHVHLSTNIFTAYEVGRRHGKAVVLEVDARKMYQDGYKFYVSTNRVWLTDFVPPQYLTRCEVENFSR